MANPKKRVPENVPGDFFVDSTCIDCDACRQIAPAIFGKAADTSFVKAQPATSSDGRQALRSLLACPTGSIGCLGNGDVKVVMKVFPLVIEKPVYFSLLAITWIGTGMKSALRPPRLLLALLVATG
jgi:ferredoxin